MKTSRERQTKNAHFKISMSEKYSLMRYKPDLKYVIKADTAVYSSSKLGLEFCIFILYTDGKLYIKKNRTYHSGHIFYVCVFIKTYERMITILENQKR